MMQHPATARDWEDPMPKPNRRPEGPPRDWQRQRVYDWECQVLFPLMDAWSIIPTSVTIEEARDLVKRGWEATGAPGQPPEVLMRKRTARRSSFCWGPMTFVIKIAPCQMSPETVLHELAHALDHARNGYSRDAYSPHGPGFMGAYLYLLDHFYGMSADTLRLGAEDRGIVVARWLYGLVRTKRPIIEAASLPDPTI